MGVCKIEKKKIDYMFILVIALAILFLFSQWQIYNLKKGGSTTGGDELDLNEIMPSGIPSIYGSELGVSFDSVESSLTTLANLDKSIDYTTLGSAEQIRFTKIAKTKGTSCEFCCGMGSNGFGYQSGTQADCGCAHNFAFSGLTKYLLKNHANQFSDKDILQELQKWKMLFFPQQMIARYAQENGITNIAQLPGMVGGC